MRDLSQIPQGVHTLWAQLSERAPSYLVGGAVRDLLEHRMPHDWDLATALQPEDLLRLGAEAGYGVTATGAKWGTVTFITPSGPCEVTTFRRDGRYQDGRHPQTVTFTNTIEEDLARRDFTINAMALSLEGILIDPYGGQRDLYQSTIRTVGDPVRRFQEDPLRLWRAVRMIGLDHAGHSLTLSSVTAETIQRYKALSLSVSAERQRDELCKLLQTPHFDQALRAADDLGLISLIWPEWEATRHFNQRNPHHRYLLHDHNLMTASLGPTPLLRLAGLLHDIAKPQCLVLDNDGIGHFYDHAEIGARYVRSMLTRLRFPLHTIESVAILVNLHMFPWEEASLKAQRRLVRTIGEARVQELLTLYRMDLIATGTVSQWDNEDAVRKAVASLFDWGEEPPAFGKAPPLAVSGRDVMSWCKIPPGKAVGQWLERIADWVDEDPARNTREQIAAFVQTFDAALSHGKADTSQ